jgi:hypothetical protein
MTGLGMVIVIFKETTSFSRLYHMLQSKARKTAPGAGTPETAHIEGDKV